MKTKPESWKELKRLFEEGAIKLPPPTEGIVSEFTTYSATREITREQMDKMMDHMKRMQEELHRGAPAPIHVPKGQLRDYRFMDVKGLDKKGKINVCAL